MLKPGLCAFRNSGLGYGKVHLDPAAMGPMKNLSIKVRSTEYRVTEDEVIIDR
jgi:hypothetical protein